MWPLRKAGIALQQWLYGCRLGIAGQSEQPFAAGSAIKIWYGAVRSGKPLACSNHVVAMSAACTASADYDEC